MSKRLKTKLTVYLVKSEYEDEPSMLNPEKIPGVQIVPGAGNLYHLRSSSSHPRWIESFFGNSIDAEPFFNATSSAVLIVPVEVEANHIRHFAITFGYGLALLNKSAIEERFGLRTVLNTVSADSIRRVAKTEVARNARKSSVQMPKKSQITDFALDIEQDLLNGITAVGDDDAYLSGTLSGADSLSVSAEANVDNISEFLLNVYAVYARESYKRDFAWIDHISPVKDRETKIALDQKAIEIINAGEETVWMAVPSIITWENVMGFRYQGSGATHADILIEDVVSTLKKPLESMDQLRNKQIRMISSIDEQEIDHWSAYRCLYGELEHEGNQYCINGGEWFRIEADYVKEINRRYQDTKLSDIDFVTFRLGEESEGEYNARLAASNKERFILMDQKFIDHGGSNSKFELCDVLTADNQFVHVKRYSGSATLSHLFNQGLTTAELIRSDSRFLQKANSCVARQRSANQNVELTPRDPKTVVFAIISKKDDSRPNIPFFSKIAFCNVKSRLEMMGIEVSLAAVLSHTGTDTN